MQETIDYTSKLGKIYLSDTSPFILERIEGLDGAINEIVTSKNVQQDGISVCSTSLNKRNPIIYGAISCNNIKEMDYLKEQIIRVFNPKYSGTLIYKTSLKEYKINCIVEKGPVFSENVNYELVKFMISLICPDPYLEDINETLEDITTWTGGAKFPLKIPFKLKQKGDTRKNIFNSGQVETPIKIKFKGPALNPKVTNITTGEFIKINKELTSDDTLIINTAYGNKTVEIENLNGAIENAFHYIDLTSTFFDLEVGDNIIEYSVDSLEPAGVQIIYKNRYLGV